MKNQKGFVNILLIIIVVVLVGVGVYFLSNRQITPPGQEMITVRGEFACLPKKPDGSGINTLECAFGLKATNGQYYRLRDPSTGLYPGPQFFPAGSHIIEVSGTLSTEEFLAADGRKYDVVGVINVTSIKKVE